MIEAGLKPETTKDGNLTVTNTLAVLVTIRAVNDAGVVTVSVGLPYNIALVDPQATSNY